MCRKGQALRAGETDGGCADKVRHAPFARSLHLLATQDNKMMPTVDGAGPKMGLFDWSRGLQMQKLL